jgi:hypothetical protein
MKITHEKLARIQNEIRNCRLDLEKKAHGHTHEVKKPTFKPNRNFGEGKAGKLETDYQSELKTQLKDPYNKIKAVLRKQGTDDHKKQEIDAIIQDLQRTNYKEIVNQHIYKISDNAIDKADKIIKQLEKEADKEATERRKYEPDQAETLSPLLIQQYSNAEDILDSVGWDIDQAWQRCKIVKQTRPNFKCNFEDYVDEAFARAEKRTELMAWYGWFKSDELSELATMLVGMGILGDIEADWTPCEVAGNCETDGPVCDDCWALYDGNPYLIVNWPEEPHIGCRCNRENYRLASMNN